MNHLLTAKIFPVNFFLQRIRVFQEITVINTRKTICLFYSILSTIANNKQVDLSELPTDQEAYPNTCHHPQLQLLMKWLKLKHWIHTGF